MTTIMTVDDAKTMRCMVQAILENEGYTVITAENGLDALKKLETNQVDMALVDFHMPNMNGTALIRKLQQMPEHKDMPILMLTTESSQFKKDKAKELGANGWLTKPFDPATLANAVQTLLAKHGNKKSS
jgi:two-component system, chemotaxis family, chemotaxis protein CheY